MKILILIAIAVTAMIVVAWLLPWWVTLALVGALSIWLVGWLVTATYMFYFDPRFKDESPADRRGRRQACLVINFFLWPATLSQVPSQFRFHRDIETGKRPAWLVLADGESTSADWATPDGRAFWVATTGEQSGTPSTVMLSHEASEAPVAEPIAFRVRMTAPSPGEWSEWHPMQLRPPEPPDEYPEEEDDDEETSYEGSIQLARGKYEVAVRLSDRSGGTHETAGVVMIVSDSGDYPS